MNYDIGIIGAGVAGTFAALKIVEKHPSTKAIIFDIGRPPGKRRRQLEGFLGCFPGGDGKLYTNDVDKVNTICDGRRVKHAHTWISNHLKESNAMKLVVDSLPTVGAQRRLKKAQFEITTNNYYQWKPDSIHDLAKKIADQLEQAPKLTFSFDNEIYRVSKKKQGFQIATANGDFYCQKVIICAGRSGWRWASNLYRELGITIDDNYSRFGVRVEISGQYMKDFNKSHCTLIKDDLELGPLSWNGTVIPEDHADLVISAFRSNEDRWKSEKVSFSLTRSIPFENSGVYQADRLGKLSFLLFNDRVGKERIKLFLKKESQLNLLPEYNWLASTLEEVNILIPNLINRGYFHVPNIIPQPAKIKINSNLESEVEGMFVAGESARITGILAAAITGTVCAEGVCK